MLNIDFTKYQGLIFDLDGTLIDSMPIHCLAWQQVASEHGVSISNDFVYAHGGCSSLQVALDIQALGHDIGDPQAFVARKVELFRSHILEIPLFPKVFGILQEARTRGTKIVIGTGTQRINAEDAVRIHHMEGLVDYIISANDVTKHKPHPETYLKALELMGLNNEQCLVIEDSQPGIQAAAAAKIDCLEVCKDQLVKLHINH